jgi:hypothetical protein
VPSRAGGVPASGGVSPSAECRPRLDNCLDCRGGGGGAPGEARGRSAYKWRLRAECSPEAECPGVPQLGEARWRSAYKGVCGRSACSCGRSAARGRSAQECRVRRLGEARGRSACRWRLRAECLQLRAECRPRAECPGVPNAAPDEAGGRSAYKGVCGRSAARGRSAGGCLARRLERLGGGVPTRGSAGGVPSAVCGLPPAGGVPSAGGSVGGVPTTFSPRTDCR